MAQFVLLVSGAIALAVGLVIVARHLFNRGQRVTDTSQRLTLERAWKRLQKVRSIDDVWVGEDYVDHSLTATVQSASEQVILSFHIRFDKEGRYEELEIFGDSGEIEISVEFRNGEIRCLVSYGAEVEPVPETESAYAEMIFDALRKHVASVHLRLRST